MNEKHNADIIGGFPIIDPDCQGCGKPLELKNAWMTDGCPCNSVLGCNSMNETRWRLLVNLQQQRIKQLEQLEAAITAVRNAAEAVVAALQKLKASIPEVR